MNALCKLRLLPSLLLFGAMPVLAHHGTSGSYDESKLVDIAGTVKEFRWRNPHSALFITSVDASGKQVTYTLEMGGPGALAKAGMTRDTFKPGDRVQIQMHPSLTNPISGYSPSRLRMEVNGKVLTTGSGE